MIKKVSISDGFHGAQNINLNIKNDNISVFQYKRLINHMCGVKNCICGPQHGWIVDGMPKQGFFDLLMSAAYDNEIKKNGGA
jgi:hypothetical protein